MEIAFVAANKLRMELDRKQNTISSRMISIFTRHPGHYITTMLVGNNIALVIYGIVMAIILEPYLSIWIKLDTLVLTAQTIISTFIILVTAEFLPKTLFRINPNTILNLLAVPVLFFYILFYPITAFTMWLSKKVIKNVLKGQIDEQKQNQVFGKVDLDNLVMENHETQSVPEDQVHDIKIFRNALDFSNIKLRECTIPRTEIEALELSSDMELLRQKFIDTGFSRILIYKDTIDNIIGYVHCSVLFRNPQSIKAALSEILIVPETMPAHKLLNLFTREHKSVAVVVDEFGGTAGMVTIEDIMEEIFGEIEDEHDMVELIEQQINDKEYILSCRLEIDYLNDKYNLNLPESDDFETLAGLILFYNQSIPKLNEVLIIKGFRIKILQVSNTQIKKIQLNIES